MKQFFDYNLKYPTYEEGLNIFLTITFNSLIIFLIDFD